MGNGFIKVERYGWFIDIETLDISERPNWEIRCRIRRSKQERAVLRELDEIFAEPEDGLDSLRPLTASDFR